MDINQRHEQIFIALAKLHYLTVKQVTRLLFSEGSFKYVHEMLFTLYKEGYLVRVNQPSAEVGTKTLIYLLGKKGIRYLRDIGQTVNQYPSERLDRQMYFMNHTLAINDFLIASSLIQRENTGVVLREFKHDIDLKKTLKVVPDAWLDFALMGKERQCIWLEMDMATRDAKQFKKKIKAIVEFSQKGYKEAFGTSSITVAFVTPISENRVKTMLTWIEDQLVDMYEEEEADLFRVAYLNAFEPEKTFLADVWYIPHCRGKHTQVSLLELPS